MRDLKATTDDGAPRDVLKVLGEDGLKVVTQLVSNIYETGSDVVVVALKKTPVARKCSSNHAVSLVAHTSKIVARILRRRIERKIEDAHGEASMCSERKMNYGCNRHAENNVGTNFGNR
jgi:hypothetical protein